MYLNTGLGEGQVGVGGLDFKKKKRRGRAE
jgi:hypothetical protein